MAGFVGGAKDCAGIDVIYTVQKDVPAVTHQPRRQQNKNYLKPAILSKSFESFSSETPKPSRSGAKRFMCARGNLFICANVNAPPSASPQTISPKRCIRHTAVSRHHKCGSQRAAFNNEKIFLYLFFVTITHIVLTVDRKSANI